MDASLRQLVGQRAGGRCEYCLLPQEFSELHFHIEHVTPRQHGGAGAPQNLALACPDCNLAKGPNLAAFDPGGRQKRSKTGPASSHIPLALSGANPVP